MCFAKLVETIEGRQEMRVQDSGHPRRPFPEPQKGPYGTQAWNMAESHKIAQPLIGIHLSTFHLSILLVIKV